MPVFAVIGRWLSSRTPRLYKRLRPAWLTLHEHLGLESYWARRKHLRYYAEVVRLAKIHVPRGESVLDVGSFTTEVLLAMDWFPRRVALDLNRPLKRPGIESIAGDFMAYVPPTHFDLVLCLQVIEHVENPAAFLSKLLVTGRTVILSVPYKWPQGRAASHVNDPIDEHSLARWSGRQPLETLLVSESGDRLIAVYR